MNVNCLTAKKAVSFVMDKFLFSALWGCFLNSILTNSEDNIEKWDMGMTGQTDTHRDQKKCAGKLVSMEQLVFPPNGIKISEIKSINSAHAVQQVQMGYFVMGEKWLF